MTKTLRLKWQIELTQGSQRAPAGRLRGSRSLPSLGAFLRGQDYLMQVPKRAPLYSHHGHFPRPLELVCPAARATFPERSVSSGGWIARVTTLGLPPREVCATSPGLQEPSTPEPREPRLRAARATSPRQSPLEDLCHLSRPSVPSPGHQGRLTGVAGTSPISPADSIPPPLKSSATGAASVAYRIWPRPPTSYRLCL